MSSDPLLLGRRDLLKLGAASALGMAMSGLTKAAEPRKDVSCLLIWLGGGLSHIDSFDPKPDAPPEIRGAFRSIPTRIAGVRFSEHLPRLAEMADKFALIRSLDPQIGTHELAAAYAMSGQPYDPERPHPCIGSVVSAVLGPKGDEPAFVQFDEIKRFGIPRCGFLDTRHAGRIDSVMSVWDSDESEAALPSTTQRYGFSIPGISARVGFEAIARGSRFVVMPMLNGWDHHREQYLYSNFRYLPALDHALAGLLEDLESSGRLDSTLVVVMTDFGRTPRVNERGGRDHWSHSAVALMAGAGIRGGTVLGSTDRHGAEVVSDRVTFNDIAATIYDRLGIPLSTRLPLPDGGSVPLISGGRVIRELV